MSTVTQAQLKKLTIDTMEDTLRISPKQASDYNESLAAVIEEAMANGQKVSLFGIVTLTPVGIPAKPKRKGTDRITGEEKTYDAEPAKFRVKALVGKRVKEALPDNPNAGVGKKLIAEAKARAKAYAERAAAREAEAAAPAPAKKTPVKKTAKRK